MAFVVPYGNRAGLCLHENFPSAALFIRWIRLAHRFRQLIVVPPAARATPQLTYAACHAINLPSPPTIAQCWSLEMSSQISVALRRSAYCCR
ncbi:hypothetical protein DOTSEDRAFT_67677 [Dothistroma septosporum NZE10]|uniref:Uncharacterized protein n=1 Tax=Dothistroma septosporum (strain NZE10 / CBS 128990) TaxID=675120 RepID=N1PYW9_DOTSN|nr:hypothetical protein DOTSEDRAFT_67677 [Dothistroma septosporum NZE10]